MATAYGYLKLHSSVKLCIFLVRSTWHILISYYKKACFVNNLNKPWQRFWTSPLTKSKVLKKASKNICNTSGKNANLMPTKWLLNIAHDYSFLKLQILVAHNWQCFRLRLMLIQLCVNWYEIIEQHYLRGFWFLRGRLGFLSCMAPRPCPVAGFGVIAIIWLSLTWTDTA